MSLVFVQLRHELVKLFARKRTHVGFVVFLGAELLIYGLLHLPRVKKSLATLMGQNGYGFGDLYTGPTLAFLMVSYTVVLLGGLYLALVAGDLVAKEAEDGTLRMILCRPISRFRLLALKYVACAGYTFALIFFIAASALAVGIAFQGMGKLFVYAPLDGVFAVYSPGEGLFRFAIAMMDLAAGLLTVSTLAFALSCLNMKPATATIVTLSILFLDLIVRTIPYFKSIEPYCLSANIGQWVHLFDDYIPWPQIVAALLFLLAVDATLIIVAAVVFRLRDFKS